MANKQRINPNSILVPIRSKVNKSGSAYIEHSNNHITEIVARYDNGMVQTKAGDVFECIPWGKSGKEGKQLAAYVATK